MFEIRKAGKLVEIKTEGSEWKPLYFITSIAGGRARAIHAHFRYQVERADIKQAQKLIEMAFKNPCDKTFQALVVLDNYYSELSGGWKHDPTARRGILDRRNSAAKDIASIKIRDGDADYATNLADCPSTESLCDRIQGAKKRGPYKQKPLEKAA